LCGIKLAGTGGSVQGGTASLVLCIHLGPSTQQLAQYVDKALAGLQQQERKEPEQRSVKDCSLQLL
jgi:hypothetical protein